MYDDVGQLSLLSTIFTATRSEPAMKRKLVTFSTCIILLISTLIAANVGAHPVTVPDTSRAEWFAQGPSASNIGAIVRNTAGRGEFVWSDAKRDQRIASTAGATGVITREADLVRFNITADTSNLYFMAKLERYSGLSNNPPVELMITIDSDHSAGQTALPDGVATNVISDAAWEYAVQTQFTSAGGSNNAPRLYDHSASPSTCVGCAAQLVSAAVYRGSFVEIKVPWDQLGGQPLSTNTLRFTVSTYYADHRAPADNASKAIDILTTKSTLGELSDGTIDYYVELHFNAQGEVFAPLLISEFLPDPPTTRDPEGEWIEIYNPNSFDVGLAGYKLGDQPYRNGSQGMVQLPNQTLASNQAIVIANTVSVFMSRYPSVPANKIIEMNTLAPYTDWASGHISLQNTNSGNPFKESLVLLDPRDVIVDMVQYATPILPSGLDPDNKPIILAGSSVTPNASYDRCPASRDTNDSNLDFVLHSTVDSQTPGTPCAGLEGIDLRISKDGPATMPLGGMVQYLLSFSNAGVGPTAATSVVITDTLPDGLTCTTQTATAGVVFTGTCPGGTNLSWTITSLAPGSSGVVTLTATLENRIGMNTVLVNQAGITSNPLEPVANRANNHASQTLITEGTADLTVSSTWPTTTHPGPGSLFSYIITYSDIGADDANDITIMDTLPAGITLVSASAPGLGFNNATSGTLIWHDTLLAYQDSGEITLVVKINDNLAVGSTLTNNVTVSSNPVDSPTNNNSEQKSLTVGNYLRFLPLIVK
jgi:uncharacterized repeat protein (TIGR01451 family)